MKNNNKNVKNVDEIKKFSEHITKLYNKKEQFNRSINKKEIDKEKNKIINEKIMLSSTDSEL